MSIREEFEKAFEYFRDNEKSDIFRDFPKNSNVDNINLEIDKKYAIWAAKWMANKLIQYGESIPSAGHMLSTREIRQLIKELE